MDVVSDFVADAWVHVASNYIGAPARPLRSALHRNEVGVHEPRILVVVVEPIKKVEGLLADERVVAINIHNDFTRLAEVARSGIPVTQGSHPFPVPNYPKPVVDPGVIAHFFEHNFSRVVVGVIVDHVDAIVGVVLLVNGLEEHLVRPIRAILHQVAEGGHHAYALLRSVAIQVVLLV